ncbi:HU domain-containing protein [Hymenobacter weizhouensis]|uniref:HU domain-containing protein n=1 Tax=Hymenobacter sp. YIM 151500-1 TaxID=2987689 RepID=UPI002226904D|nr:SPOR domain-containing protein [Hymenobacter sp. YIM 151500-1]UYZ64117.1 SPOR domain-containing protein [Hymenobacter sp. YIM 151500-1]
MLSDHIRTLLRDHDCVIIPDFGGLIADYAPAQIHPVRHTLAPPAKRVAFNQSLTRNDGLLVDALSRALRVSTAQARQLVREAVLRMQQELENGRRVELSGVGNFRRAPGRGVEFEYTGAQNLLNASFGLPELVSRPVRATDALLARERPAPAPLLASGRSPRALRLFRAAAAVVITGLVLSANYLVAERYNYLPESWRLSDAASAASQSTAQPAADTQPMQRQQAALGNNALASTSELTAAPAPTVAPAQPAKAAAKPAPAKAKTPARAAKLAATGAGQGRKPAAKTPAKAKPKAPGWEKAAATNAAAGSAATTIKGRTGRFFVVAGSYTSLKNAEKGRQALARLGHPARVILPQPGSRQFKLSVADFADRTSADRQASILRKRMGNLWVLNY